MTICLRSVNLSFAVERLLPIDNLKVGPAKQFSRRFSMKLVGSSTGD